MPASFTAVVAFLRDNPWVYPLVTGLFSVLIHSLSAASPRVVAGLQAVSLDLPKLWTAITGSAPPPAPPSASAGQPPVPPPSPASPSLINAARVVSALVLGTALALAGWGCSGAQQAQERVVATDVERAAPVVLPILARSLACLLDAYKAGADTARSLSTECLPALVADVAAADAAAHSVGPEADGGAK